MSHPWEKYIRTCRKRNSRSSGSRSATARASGRWPVCRDAARPASAGRSSATRGSRPTRTNPDGRTGRSVRRRAAATSPAPRGARPTAGAPNRAGTTARHATACGRGWRRGRGGGRTSRFPIPGRVPIFERPPPAGARRRHVRRRRRVRPPHAPARRAGHGHVASPTHTPAGGGEATRTGTA